MAASRACRYLAWNPVEASLVTDPLEWAWSSARPHAGLEQPPIPLAETALRAAVGNGSNWRERYRTHLQAENDEDPPKRASSVAGAGFEPATSGL